MELAAEDAWLFLRHGTPWLDRSPATRQGPLLLVHSGPASTVRYGLHLGFPGTHQGHLTFLSSTFPFDWDGGGGLRSQRSLEELQRVPCAVSGPGCSPEQVLSYRLFCLLGVSHLASSMEYPWGTKPEAGPAVRTETQGLAWPWSSLIAVVGGTNPRKHGITKDQSGIHNLDPSRKAISTPGARGLGE